MLIPLYWKTILLNGLPLNQNLHLWVSDRSFNEQVQPLVLSLILFPFSLCLVRMSTCKPEWAETWRLRIIPVYPCNVFFNIAGMSAFIFSVFRYSRNARFTIRSQAQASRKSREWPMWHPTSTKNNLHLCTKQRKLEMSLVEIFWDSIAQYLV